MGRFKHNHIIGAFSILLIASLAACKTAATDPSSDTSATRASAGTTPVVTSGSSADDITPTETETTDMPAVTSPVPSGFLSQWKCDKLASDGKTDTSFYVMYFRTDGYFNMYDEAAGNPGISGNVLSYTNRYLDCELDMEDNDVPHCWTIDSSEAVFDYELDGDTLKLGHNGIWITFHRDSEIRDDLPKSLDELIYFSLPQEFELEMEYHYEDDTPWYPVIERAYNGNEQGYLSVGIFSDNGIGVGRMTGEKISIDEYINDLAGKREIAIDGETGCIGTRESDDMPDMVIIAYVTHGDYAFEFRLTNADDQVTEEQIKNFEQILKSVEFK